MGIPFPHTPHPQTGRSIDGESQRSGEVAPGHAKDRLQGKVVESGARDRGHCGEIAKLPEPVREHIEQVRAASGDITQRRGLDAVSHDICRVTPARDLLRMVGEYGIPVTDIDRAFPVFLHGPVGAEVLRLAYAIENAAVLDPICYHTMGRAAMTPLDKVPFLADKLDPSTVGRYPFIGEVARLAREDLDRAPLVFIDHQVKAFIDHKDLVHPGMIEVRNAALLGLRGDNRRDAEAQRRKSD